MTKIQGRISLESLLLVTISIAVLIRILNLGSREFWYDEVLTLLLSTGQRSAYNTPETTPVILSAYTPLLSLPPESGLLAGLQTVRSLLKSLIGGEPHPPLLFLGQHLWLRLFGNGEAAFRSLGALLSVGAIGSAYGFGRVLLGHRAGLMLAALLGTNPFYLLHSLNVRMYGPLVLWTVLSGWALLHLTAPSEQRPKTWSRRVQFGWSGLLILSVFAGLMTFYLFAYWVIVLAVVVFYRDRARWWQQGLRLAIGVLLTLPWAFWGTIKQLKNADLKRFSNGQANPLQHLQNLIEVLGNHLLLGDWATSLPPVAVVIAGLMMAAILLGMILWLWRTEQRPLLVTVLLLGIFPLLIALTVDVIGRKFTIGFGEGRTLIFILPGCLLLLVLGLEQLRDRWRSVLTVGLLVLYLSIDIGSYSLKPRQMFHQIASLVGSASTPTLIAMNSQAWGHVMRLAYYIPPTAPVALLAQESADLPAALQNALVGDRYTRVLWLESARPIWSPASTPAEKQQIEQILQKQFKLVKTEPLSGTMKSDEFVAKLYTQSNL